MIVIKTLDAHVCGAPLRLIVDGVPAPRGNTMAEKLVWAERHAGHVRRALMLEPRGHDGMVGAMLAEPCHPDAHAGVLFMDADGFYPLSGHGVIAVTAMALERRLIVPPGDPRLVAFDTAVGVIHAAARCREADPKTGALSSRVTSVGYAAVPSFVFHGGVDVRLPARAIRADIAFGGAFYAIVDGEAVGVPLDADHLPELQRAGQVIARAVEASGHVVHPVLAGVSGVRGTIFTGPAQHPTADLRCVAVMAGGAVDRSPSGTGLAAIMAVIDAMGLLTNESSFAVENVFGMTLRGRVARRAQVGDYQAIVPEVEGEAWVTGEHTFLIDANDPLRDGVRVGAGEA